jgi:uncharacterized protein (TIGR02147 family)
MNKTVFDFLDYKAYLRHLTGERGTRHGMKVRIATALGCQPTHISQVLHRSVHFSLEHAEILSRFLAHNEEEGRFFLLLVQKGRAGSKSLERFFQSQIDEMLKQHLVLTKRLKLKTTLSIEEQVTYYSSWYFGAIHIALTIPALRNKERLADYFDLPLGRITEILEFLITAGLCTVENGQYITGRMHISLGSDSRLINQHHSVWRQRAIANLDRNEQEGDLHYSAVITIAKNDFAVLKEDLMQLLKKHRQIVKASQEEEVYCYSMDLFGLRR